ncbi:hypothetical protein D6C85_10331 [Aureobasidium pullulans]|uniref:Uncharacterized protein n=1 Tax=Aureobasidium pullulans TaxID=5580 RepID=A0A4S9W0D6_AURPU|nr:hypothetical protein D6C85_10331 [Aureobasidium pullulans]
MIDSDTDMSDCYSDDGLLAYKTPYPPSLPANEPNWEQSKAYGQGKSRKTDWPFEQRLGYPSTREGWHPLIFKWGLQVLDAAGFINFETTKPHTYNPNGYWESKRNMSGTLAERIHPVLRKEMWHLFTDEEYKTIMPALLLATAILDDPVMLCLFYALSRPTDQLTTFEDPHLGECKKLNIPATLTEQEQWEVHQKLCAMREWTSFRWDGSQIFVDSGSLAATTPDCALGRDIPASGPETRRSTIGMSVEFYHAMYLYQERIQDFNAVMYGAMNAASVPEDHKIKHIDLVSAFKRTNLTFATTIVHEFMHAFNLAHYKRPLGDAGIKVPHEPWLNDNRSNELGWATTQYLFGGSMNATTFYDPNSGPHMERHSEIYIPFGLWFEERWDQWRITSDVEHVRTENWELFHRFPFTVYPIPQEYVHDLTTGETWEERVPRDGLQAALRLPKLHEWAVKLNPGNNIMNPLEGITIA